jgi:tetratricopeptide (TPR) repeat protein
MPEVDGAGIRWTCSTRPGGGGRAHSGSWKPNGSVSELLRHERIRRLLDEFVSNEALIPAIDRDPGLSPALKEIARQEAAARPQLPEHLVNEAWPLSILCGREANGRPMEFPEDWHRAKRLAEAASREEPARWDVLFVLALALYRLQDYDGALKALEQADLDREWAGSNTGLVFRYAISAGCLWKLGRAEAALDHLKRADAKVPADSRSFHHSVKRVWEETHALLGVPEPK